MTFGFFSVFGLVAMLALIAGGVALLPALFAIGAVVLALSLAFHVIGFVFRLLGVLLVAVFASAAPVVVVPDSVSCRSAATRIVVGWNASREAALAIRGALPLLRQAESVVVLEGEPVENPFGLRHLPKLDLRAWLRRRGIEADYREFRPPGKERASALLDAAHAASADLIVMGAWGPSRITALVLGGTTRPLFQQSDLPLLVAH
jgi:nucleotide-binding universal stress UspA family protein